VKSFLDEERMIFKRLFGKRLFFVTIIVFFFVVVFGRLGVWQLDRLKSRRAFNAQVSEQMNANLLVLSKDNLELDFGQMEYRHIKVKGFYDHDQEIVIRNQVWVNQYGVHENGVYVLTPLLVEGAKQAILVNRGWVPLEDSALENRKKYHEPGEVTVSGVIRLPHSEGEIGLVKDPTLMPGQDRQDAWNFVNIEKIAEQTTHTLLPVYVQQSADETWEGFPYRQEVFIDLTEGAHLGFAVQWFVFAVILLFGYPYLIMRYS
jgi:surfeit locus 1 family protein